MKMKVIEKILVISLVFNLVSCLASGATPPVADKCGDEFQKLTACLMFATGKQETPSTECCTSASEIKVKNPFCLCYIIQQIHDGSNTQIKSIGIQEARLIQLPSACNLKNATNIDCPKLLNLPSNSPDAAFFKNATASASSSSSSTTTSGKSSPAGNSTSTAGAGLKYPVRFTMIFTIVFLTILIWI